MKYVYGKAGELRLSDVPPRSEVVRQNGEAIYTRWYFPCPMPIGFRVERGVMSETKTLSGARIYARELPDDMLPDLAAIDAELEVAKERFKALNLERQELLEAGAQRGKRVRVASAE